MVQGLTPARKWILGTDHPVERRRLRELYGKVEGGDGPVLRELGAGRVGTGDLELAEPNRREVRAGGRHPRKHHPPSRPRRSKREVQRGLGADAVERHVHAAKEVGPSALRPQAVGMGRAAKGRYRVTRVHHLGRAQLAGSLALARVLGNRQDPAGRGELAQGDEGQGADSAGADDKHRSAGLDPRPKDRVNGAGQWLH
jgi:hypothetical protein